MSDTATLTRKEAEPRVPRERDETTGADDAVYRASRRRFTIAVLIGIGVMAIPYLWVLWDLWSGLSFLPQRADGLLLRPSGTRHVPRSFEPAQHTVGDRGIPSRRPHVHLFRDIPVSDQDAGPSVDEQVRRRLDGAFACCWPG